MNLVDLLLELDTLQIQLLVSGNRILAQSITGRSIPSGVVEGLRLNKDALMQLLVAIHFTAEFEPLAWSEVAEMLIERSAIMQFDGACNDVAASSASWARTLWIVWHRTLCRMPRRVHDASITSDECDLQSTIEAWPES